MLKEILSLINLSAREILLTLSITLNAGLVIAYHDNYSKRIEDIKTLENQVRARYEKSIEEITMSNSKQLIRCAEEKEAILRSGLIKIDSIERKTIDLYRKYELLNNSVNKR